MVDQPTPGSGNPPADLYHLCLVVAEHAPLPMATIEESSHIVRYANPAFCRLLDKPREQIVGRSFHEMLPEKDAISALLNRVFLTGEPASHSERHPSKPYPVLWSYAMWPVMANERPVGVMVQVTPPTQLQEKTLEMNEALLLGSVRQNNLTTAANTWNARLQEEIAERTRTEAALRAARMELDRLNAALEQTVRNRTAKLRETVAELEHFSYTITHDMRAPLRAMRGLGGILLEECSDCLNPTRREYLRRIADSADRMDKLIVDALQYSGVVRQRFKLVPVNAAGLLRELVESYPEFQPPRANIHIDTPLPVVLASRAGLTQCFSNLLGNAVKFVHPGRTPEVRVWAESIQSSTPSSPKPQTRGSAVGHATRHTQSGSTLSPLGPHLSNLSPLVRIWFEDKGIGIEKQYHDKIWQMFQQLNKTFEGTGIGLALVRKVVDRMGGTVGVESEPGHGSRFWVELKRADGQPHPNPAPQTAPIDESSHHPLR